ncbi:MAG: hypothetical protein RMJ85_12645 [Anaerolineales bacterium]|nr:hypothetical protein [Anaerolineales bacterium]
MSLLSRFLPLGISGMTAEFLEQYAPTARWILDPFGSAPEVAVEAARLGKNVLVAVNNPILRFLLELATNPLSSSELRSALADFAAAYKGEERLETHLKSLYSTRCRLCQQSVSAEAFVWERNQPTACLYQCVCGAKGEFPVTEDDLVRLKQISAADALHRARALERVASLDDPARPFAEEALNCYFPRALYALFTLINQLERLNPSPRRRQAYLALLLAACDEVNTLWPYPTERPRPRQLTTPPRFLEKNIWLALERTVERWQTTSPVVVLPWEGKKEHAVTLSSSGNIYYFEGPVRRLMPALQVFPPEAIVTALPRPNQAFWALSVLWTGWLWGREHAEPLKVLLQRRRYDWNWHASALYAALKRLPPSLSINTPFLALMADPEPSFLSAVLLAGAAAGFDLNGLALRTTRDPLQILWRKRPFLRSHHNEIDPLHVQTSIETFLHRLGEPAPYLHLHAAALHAMATDHALHWQENALSNLHAPIQVALTRPSLRHYSDSQNIETGVWGLKTTPSTQPLADRVEIAVVSYLQKHPGATSEQIEHLVNNTFRGLYTPAVELIRAILTSYGIETDGGWYLRPEDSPTLRRTDLESARQQLTALGERLGFLVTFTPKPWRILHWQESGGKNRYTYHLLTSAVVGRILYQSRNTDGYRLLVLPGGRAGLLAYKLERDPALRSRAEGWRVLKFRHLRRLVELSHLTLERWEKELSNDPLEPPEQMKLF